MKTTPAIWGLLVELETPDAILAAARKVRQAGYRRFDAHTPYPVAGLPAELEMRKSRIGSIVLIGGLVGAAVGFWMQFYAMAIDYPLDVGGKPLNSWPAFIPITFEVLILVGALSAFLGMLFLNGLPEPHHPLFGVPQFSRASQDRFFISIEAADPLFDLDATQRFLETLQPLGGVILVPETEPTIEELAEEEPGAGPKAEEPVAV
jgi:hypothetical protein